MLNQREITYSAGKTRDRYCRRERKHQAIKAALKGQWLNGLVTDEESAMVLLAEEKA